jgi:hypothetical protein
LVDADCGLEVNTLNIQVSLLFPFFSKFASSEHE